MFDPGDVVVYRHHVCKVASIREAYFEGRDYYELHALFESHLKLFVAIGEAQAADVRPAMSRENALAFIDAMVDIDPIDESAMDSADSTPTLKNRRIKEEYERLLKDGAPEDLVPIIKSVRQHVAAREKNGRCITAVDKKFSDMAQRMLYDELSVALGIDHDDVETFIERRLSSRS